MAKPTVNPEWKQAGQVRPLKSRLVTVVNSPGFWFVIFAGFGLFSLSIGEEKIQKRMLRNQMRFHSVTGTSFGDAVDSKTRTPLVTVEKDSGVSDPGVIKPKRYRLSGLRWILSIAVLIGIVMMAVDRSKPHS